MSRTPRQLPYGLADFTAIHRQHMVYIDKTNYIAELERAGNFLFFLRPRRFGKSLTVSQLFCYYDISFAERFEELFSQTWIGQNPTPERNSYLVLHFNFAEVDPDLKRIQQSFETYTESMFLDFILRYKALVDDEAATRIKAVASAGDRLSYLFTYAA